jgi:hypothetical protein
MIQLCECSDSLSLVLSGTDVWRLLSLPYPTLLGRSIHELFIYYLYKL